MLTGLFLLLLAILALAVALQVDRRARQRKLQEFAATAGRTLQLDTCGGIKTSHLHEYLLALASTFRTQAMLRDLDLRPGEFKRAVTDAVDSAYLLKRGGMDRDVARGALLLFASCLDTILSKAVPADATQGDEGNFVGTAGAVVLLASVGWHAESTADLVRCALSEAAPARNLTDYWLKASQAHRDQVETAFEHTIRTALDPATAAYVRHRIFSELSGDAQVSVDTEYGSDD